VKLQEATYIFIFLEKNKPLWACSYAGLLDEVLFLGCGRTGEFTVFNYKTA